MTEALRPPRQDKIVLRSYLDLAPPSGPRIIENILMYLMLLITGAVVIFMFNEGANDYFDTITEHLHYHMRFGHPIPWDPSH